MQPRNKSIHTKLSTNDLQQRERREFNDAALGLPELADQRHLTAVIFA
jgi:hypothetical protein